MNSKSKFLRTPYVTSKTEAFGVKNRIANVCRKE